MLLPSAPLKRRLVSLSPGIDNFLFTELKKELQKPVLNSGLWNHKTVSQFYTPFYSLEVCTMDVHS